MFCSKCGKEIADDAVFCSSCGEKTIYGLKQQSNQLTVESSKGELVNKYDGTTTVVTKEKLNSLGITQHSFSERVESTDDPNINNFLFTLYGLLVKPVRKVEDLSYFIEKEGPKKISTLKEKYITTPVGFISHFLIPCIIICFFINLWAVMHVPEYDDSNPVGMYNEYYHTISVFGDFDVENSSNPAFFEKYPSPSEYESSYLYQQACYEIWEDGLSAEDTHMRKLLHYYGIHKWIIFAIIILFILGRIIYKIRIKIKDERRYKEQLSAIPAIEMQIQAAKDEREEIVSKLMPYLCYCPPKYRTSSALASFANNYRNTKVNNLNEAVREYSTEARHNETLSSFSMIYSSMQNISYSLDSVMANQGMMQQTLDSISKEIIFF